MTYKIYKIRFVKQFSDSCNKNFDFYSFLKILNCIPEKNDISIYQLSALNHGVYSRYEVFFNIRLFSEIFFYIYNISLIFKCINYQK